MFRHLKAPRRVLVAAALLASPLSIISLQGAPASADTVRSAAVTYTCTGSEDTRWTGTVDSDWATAGNWTNGVPTSSKTVCIPDPGPGSYPDITADATAKSVVVAIDSNLTLDAHLTLSQASKAGSLQLNPGSRLTIGGATAVNQLNMVAATVDGIGVLTNTSGQFDSTGDGVSNTVAVDWVIDGGTIWTRGPIDNSGHSITLAPGGVLQTDPAIPGTPTLTTNTLTVGATVDNNAAAAYLWGTNVNGNIVNAGDVRINKTLTGNLTQTAGSFGLADDDQFAIGTLNVTGNVTQSGGIALVRLAGTGTAGTNYDKVNISGTYALSGDAQLEARPIGNTFEPAIGNSFVPVHAASITGQYATVSGTNTAGTTSATASRTGTDVTVTFAATPGFVAGTVFEDADASGTSTGGDPGLDGIVVYADLNNNGIRDLGEPADATTSGFYNLIDVPAGTVHIRAEAPAGFVLTTPATVTGTVPAADTLDNVDFGMFETGTLSGTVFADQDRFGVLGNNAGVSNVTVFLDTNDNGMKDSGEPSTTTDANGHYSFTGLTHTTGTRARIVLPAGQQLTTQLPETHNISSGSEWSDDNFGLNPDGPYVPEYVAPADPVSQGTGYWLIGANGQVYSYGSAEPLGSPASAKPAAPIVGLTPSPTGAGYWAVGSDGGVFAYGDAEFHGSTGGIKLNQPAVSLAATPDGAGYWIVAKDGGVFAYGDAEFHGSAVGVTSKPIVGIQSTPSGEGYYMVASDGGVFAYGDAQFLGSTGATKLNSPIVGVASVNGGTGYYLVAADGGVFAFGTAEFHGAPTNLKLNKPIVSIKAIADGSGYWLIAADGGVFAYGSAGFLGGPSNGISGPVAQ